MASGAACLDSRTPNRKSFLIPWVFVNASPRAQMQKCSPQTPNLVHRYPNAKYSLRVEVALQCSQKIKKHRCPEKGQIHHDQQISRDLNHRETSRHRLLAHPYASLVLLE